MFKYRLQQIVQIKHELVTDFKFWNILAPFRNKLFLKQYSHLLLHHHWLLYCMYVWIFPIFVIDKIQVFVPRPSQMILEWPLVQCFAKKKNWPCMHVRFEARFMFDITLLTTYLNVVFEEKCASYLIVP